MFRSVTLLDQGDPEVEKVIKRGGFYVDTRRQLRQIIKEEVSSILKYLSIITIFTVYMQQPRDD